MFTPVWFFREVYMNARLCISAVFVLLTVSIFPVMGDTPKKLYIKNFITDSTSSDHKQMSIDIKDYMAEVMTGKLSLVTDDEIREYLKNYEISSSIESSQEDVASKLLKSIDADYLVYGKLIVENGSYIIDATMLEMKKDQGVTKKNFGDIKFDNPIYIDRASRSLAQYLLADRQSLDRGWLFGTRDPRKEFAKEVAKVDEDMKEIEADYQKGSASIKSSSERRNKSLSYSPLIRAGYGGMGSIRFADKTMGSQYQPGQGAMLDLFIYRYKDPVGDGIDMYLRGIGRQYEMKSSAAALTSPQADAKYYLDRYEGHLDKGAKIKQYSGDLGLRFVGSAYFLTAWSVYINGALRFNWIKEEYQINKVAYKKRFNAWGGVGGTGFEVALVPYIGLFAEADYAYCPVGRNSRNIEGFQAFAGITFRTNHWDN
jgi:hypothetical protein